MNTYGTLIELSSSPADTPVEPLTVAEVHYHLRLPETSPEDAEETTQLEGWITAAREIAEFHQNRDLVLKQYELSLDCWPEEEIALRAPLVSIDAVEYTDSDGNVTVMAEGVDYIVDTRKQPGIMLPPYGETWPSFTPWPSSPIVIRFTSGHESDAPFWTSGPGPRIRAGMKVLITMWHDNRLPSGKVPQELAERLFGAGALSRSV